MVNPDHNNCTSFVRGTLIRVPVSPENRAWISLCILTVKRFERGFSSSYKGRTFVKYKISYRSDIISGDILYTPHRDVFRRDSEVGISLRTIAVNRETRFAYYIPDPVETMQKSHKSTRKRSELTVAG